MNEIFYFITRGDFLPWIDKFYSADIAYAEFELSEKCYRDSGIVSRKREARLKFRVLGASIIKVYEILECW